MFGQDSPPGIRKDTLVSRICEYLRERIANFSLKPGERIDVKKLAQELSVSQTPLREALHKLVEQGLVIGKPYVGYFVVKLTAEDIQELFDLRKAMEVLALKYIIKDVDKEALTELLVRTDELEQQEDGDALTQGVRKLDEDFHVGFLIRGSRNKWLAKLGNGVIDLVKLTTQLSLNPRVACAEHRAILNAIAKRDVGKAVSLLEAHIERAKHDSIANWQRMRGGSF